MTLPTAPPGTAEQAQQAQPNATRMIVADHAQVLGWFHSVRAGTPEAARTAAARSICAALEVHAQLEEEIFYPALRATGVELPALEHSVAEHDEMRRRIQAVRETVGDAALLADALAQLMNAVLHHVADEETLVLPAAERRLAGQLQELGERMAKRRLELAQAAPRTPEPAAGAAEASLEGADPARGAPTKTALVAVGTIAAGALLWRRLRRRVG